MIHKVSGTNTQMDLFSDQTSRQSMNKSAMSSFENVMLATANKLMQEGRSMEEVARAFGMSTTQLQSVIETQTNAKTASSKQVEKTAAAQENHDSAQEAYDSLHGITPRKSEDIGNIRGNSTIHSAAGNQSVTDVGGPKGQVRYQNSIWDSEVLQRQAQAETGQDRIRAAQVKESARKQEMLKQKHEIDAEALKLSMQMGKANGVSSVAGADSYKFSQKLPPRGMSIFDSTEFARIPEKTAGEKMVDEKRNAKPKEKEFTKDLNTKSANSKSIFDSMIDSMLDNKE